MRIEPLMDLQLEHGYGYLFISRDLARIARISHRVAIMRQGAIVELVEGKDFHLKVKHAYSRELLETLPAMGRT